MRIQHNIMAMNAYRNYNTNTSALSKNLEKLSSGYKINRAGDDAAGLAISEKMRAQITGLNAAQKNVKDGISLVKTAEGAMQEIQDMLNRMDYLATQSANGTYDDPVDRANLQKEVDSLKSEINRIADSANFNGINLLDGSWSKVASTSGGDVVDTNQYDMTGLKLNNLTTATMASNALANESIDGQNASDATAAKISFRVKAGVNVDLSALQGLSVAVNGMGTVALTDMFDIKLSDGSDVTSGTTESSQKIVLTAKVAGKIDNATLTAVTTQLQSVSFACTTAVNSAGTVGLTANLMSSGSDVGEAGGGDANNAVYTFNVDLSKIDGGTKFVMAGATIEFTNQANNFTTSVGGVSGVDASGKIYIGDLSLDKAADRDKLKDRIEALFNETDGMTKSGSSLEKWEFDAGKLSGTKFSFTLTAKDGDSTVAGTLGNKGQAKVITDSNNAIKFTEESGVDGDNMDPAGAHATASFQWSRGSLKAGDVISIGGKTIEIIEEDEKEDWNNGKIKLSSITDDSVDSNGKTKGVNNLNRVLQKLGYDAGNVKAMTDSYITIEKKIQDNTTAADWAAGDGKVETGVLKEVEEPTEPEEPAETKGGKALTLQIGDTADDFNQLQVYIGDMHVTAMGFNLDEKGNITADGKSINDVDISSLEGAQDAISTIKNAINYVSSIRGDLGATQNRLEHTANNLSVMAENIQDAESTIRDTDVAEEMMSYTKNNILIQSAQAMLAQANAVPQGVLQLLG